MIPEERQSADLNCWQFAEQLSDWDKMHAPKQCALFPHGDVVPQANEVIYISAPITGIKDLNKPQFMLAEKMLLSHGCDIFNPSRIEGPIDPLEGDALWQYYMHFCVRNLPDCSGILLLPNWQNSKGACFEHKIAQTLGLDIFYSPVPDSQ